MKLRQSGEEIRWQRRRTWAPLLSRNTKITTVNAVVQSLNHVWFLCDSWTAASQASLSFIISWSFLKIMSTESVMPCHHLILCRPLLLLPSIFPNIRVFSNESTLCIRWPKYWNFSFSISPSKEYWGLIFFRLTGLISLLPKGLSRVFSSTTIWKHEFFSAQPSLWSNSHICTLSILNRKTIVLSILNNHRQKNMNLPKSIFYIHTWRRQWQPTPVLVPGKSHGRRSLVGCRVTKSQTWLSDFTLTFHFPALAGNGNPHQCSCLENPRDHGISWGAVYGVTQSRTWLKWLSSSNIHTKKSQWAGRKDAFVI